jgi:hypothetical protein
MTASPAAPTLAGVRRDDIAIAAGVAGLTVAATVLAGRHHHGGASIGVVLPGAAGVLLAWRRDRPVPVLAAVLALTLAY